MRISITASWLLLAAGWLAAFSLLASSSGGVRWLAHLERATPALLDLLLALLSLGAAAYVFLQRDSGRKILLAAILLLAILHLLNVLGFYLFTLNNGGVFANSRAIRLPFTLLGVLVPTNTAFTAAVHGFFPLFVLPVTSAVLAVITLFFGSRSQLPSRA